MNQKTIAIIVTIAALVLCGCPGIFGVFMGGLFAIISFIPNANIDVMGSSNPQSALTFGIGTLCVSLVFIVIAAIAIFVAWRRARANSTSPVPPAA